MTHTTFDGPALNDAGQTAFRAYISGVGVDSTNNEGIWSEGSGSLALVARAGGPAPGTPSGISFATFFPFNGALRMNASGQIAFTAFLKGSGVVPFENDIGIWASDPAGAVQLIARTGDMLEVGPGDFRTIEDLSVVENVAGNGDGRPSGFNNRGQLVFWASFSGGGQGIFVSNRAAVPEPAPLALLAVALPVLVGRTPRRSHAISGNQDH
jgi:hypothetical protein